MSVEGRYARHIGLFGAEGQELIGSTRVAIIGLGGLGSHLAQQLAYLGVTQFLLLDADTVSVSNLNRLIGAGTPDLGTVKVNIVARTIRAIQPQATIDAQPQLLAEGTEPPGLADVDVIFGCVDQDPVRLDILRFASAHAIAYVDLASDVTLEGQFGGRIVFAKERERCLSCLGELDQHAIARARMSEEQRAADDRIYGIDRAALAEGGPSVVSINGVVASLAVTEFMCWRTGLREPAGFLTYRGDLGTVTRRGEGEQPPCVYCTSGWGSASRGRPDA
jgi:molybdopterin/thiamine biosynthesis adenylyltransferase